MSRSDVTRVGQRSAAVTSSLRGMLFHVLVGVDYSAQAGHFLLAVLVTQELALLAPPAHHHLLLAHVAPLTERVAPPVLRRRVDMFADAVGRGRVRLIRVRLLAAEANSAAGARREKYVIRRV
jgi:hypothetical protein